MTIESYLSRIADALEAIAANTPQSADQTKPRKQKEPANVDPVIVPAVPVAPAPVAAPVSAAPAPVAAPVLPAAPVSPVIPAAGACPFTDAKGLIGYVMDAYKSMGPTKGALIQGVLSKLGVNNINEVQAKDYQALWSGIEELKK